MSSSEERLTFDQIPQLVSDLKAEIIGLKTQVSSLVIALDAGPKDQWMNLDQFRAYHPDHPARPTVYEWVSLQKVPVHKDGKKLRFLRSEIDQWLDGGRKKTQDELQAEAAEYVRTSKHGRK